MTFDNCGHSIFMATHKGMYKYLPIPPHAAAKVTMRGASAMYLYKTRVVYNNIIYWWVLCALNQDCIAPTTDLYCSFKGRDVYANCHRYDQSAINIALANHYLYDDEIYFIKNSTEVLTIQSRKSL